MAQYSTRFGALVAEALTRDGKRVSPWVVERLSGGRISHMTVRQMLRGVVPSTDLIITFAVALDMRPEPLLEAAGRPGISVDVDTWREAVGVTLPSAWLVGAGRVEEYENEGDAALAA